MGNKVPWVNAIFAAAMVNGTSLARAAEEISAPQDEYYNAYRFMVSVLTQPSTPIEWIEDYQLGVTECFKKLENAN